MTKKLFFVLMISSLILFFSCGSTKQPSDDVKDLEPSVETEQEALEGTEETEQDEQAEQDAQDQTSDSTEDEYAFDEDLAELYPPLEEIEDPDLIDISPLELEEQAAIAAEQTEQNETQITEPVEETEELPPLPAPEETPELQDELNGEETTEVAEAEETPVEPTIEIQPEDAEPEIVIVPSRSVSLKKGETLVITYPGSGWIYMGSTSEYNNLASRGRKLGTTDTKYTLLAKEAGTQIHHFYKIDNLTGEYIDDYIEVTVLEKKGNSSTVVNAPDYSQVVPKKPETSAKATPKKETTAPAATATETTPAATTATTTTTTPAPAKKNEVIEVESNDNDEVIVIDEEETEQVVDLEPLLEKARTSLSSKKYDEAYTSLSQYLEWSTDNRDEALYLLGQLLESDSNYKDIKMAVETYQTLCDSYPASKYWDQANKRIVYLKRFYINIH